MPKRRSPDFQIPGCVICGGPARLRHRRYLKTCSDECQKEAGHRRAKRVGRVNAERLRKYGSKDEAFLSHRRRLKLNVLRHYSFGELKCACCGDGNIEFLTIDHINGGGAKHRRELGGGKIAHGGGSFYTWLVKSG